VRAKQLPKRVQNVIDVNFVGSVLETLKVHNVLNLKANENNNYGLVIYPK
jgi:hypothetical protein